MYFRKQKYDFKTTHLSVFFNFLFQVNYLSKISTMKNIRATTCRWKRAMASIKRKHWSTFSLPTPKIHLTLCDLNLLPSSTKVSLFLVCFWLFPFWPIFFVWFDLFQLSSVIFETKPFCNDVTVNYPSSQLIF